LEEAMPEEKPANPELSARLEKTLVVVPNVKEAAVQACLFAFRRNVVHLPT
jgi:hypothetical protein